MNRECPTRLWLSTLLIFWGWGLGCGPAGEPDSGVAPPAETAVLPEAEAVQPVEIVRTNDYSEGVVIDHEGNIYFSHEKVITVVTPEGEDRVWAETGEPNGHKILTDGTHLVCDATHHAVLRLDADGNMLEPASTECEGKPLRGPNDLTLDPEGASTSPTRKAPAIPIPSAPSTTWTRRARPTSWPEGWPTPTASS